VLRIPFDVFAPSPELNVLGVYKTRKVRIFDGNGVQTDVRYSANPAWCIADLLTTVRGLPDSRIDWASFVAAADYCDELIDQSGEQKARFESHVAFTEEVDFDQGLLALLSCCRGFLLDTDGAIQLRIDQPRDPVFDFDMNNIIEGSFKAWYKDTRAAANRLELLFRDLENDFAIMTKLWNHEPQQARTGRVIPARLSLGNMPQHQAERIGNYLLTRAIDNNLFCAFRGTSSSLSVMPGDVVRIKHDAAPWSQAAAGDALYETFEAVEVTDNPDETRDFLCQLYRSTTYPDTAGPTQNLIGTTVRGRPAAPPPPDAWELAVYPRGFLWLRLQIPKNADYRMGDLRVLADLELERVETALGSDASDSDTTLEAASSAGFLVGDYVNIGSEILQIVGPGVREAPPTSGTWQVARAQKLSAAAAWSSGEAVYRLVERDLHFVLPPGFTLARAERTHTVGLRPGRLRILYASLVFTGTGGQSDPAELPFWAVEEFSGVPFGSLAGLRTSSGGLGTLQIPGPLATGADLVMPLVLPEDVSISWIYAQAAKSPFDAGGSPGTIGIQLKIGGEAFGPPGLLPGVVTGGATPQLVWVSGARKGNAGQQQVSIEITQVGTDQPGEDLTVYVLV
jgi:hypothetical protein